MIRELLQPEVQKFIRDHLDDDPHTLLLQASKYTGIPVREAVDQIVSRQKARTKLPDWVQQKDLIFPPPVSIEQCSSEITAAYKAELFSGKNAVDLTGGAGVDTMFLSRSFDKVIYVEKNRELVELAAYNLKKFNINNVEFVHAAAEQFLKEGNARVDLIYIDPSRRITDKKVFRLTDSQPDVLKLQEELLAKAKTVLIKTSPWLDIKKTLKELTNVFSVIVVAVKNEVKEVLFVLKEVKTESRPVIQSVNFTGKGKVQNFSFHFDEENRSESLFVDVERYLYEPNRAILKSGGFKVTGNRFSLKKLHSNTHIYTSPDYIPTFPGRIYRITEIYKGSKTKKLLGMQANIVVRNHPLTPSQIRKKYKIKDGGDTFILAVTSVNGPHLILCTSEI